MRYLQRNDYTDIMNYCKSKCKKIMIEHTNTNVNYYRGQYKGYMYGISISKHHLKLKINVTDTKLYNIVKNEKLRINSTYIKDRDLSIGVKDSLYDLMNYVSDMN